MRSRLLWNGTVVSIAALLSIGAWATGGEEGEAISRTSVSSRPRSEALESARRIDRLVDAHLGRQGIKPNEAIDDATFVRRVYLDVIGRIPTAAETERFLQNKSRDRRAELIDLLLDSPGYTSHLFNTFADVLRVKTRLARQVSGDPYIHFLKESLTQNKPYDQLVRELLTAEGAANARDNGATGYFLRDREMPEDNMANTVRVFLGTRLECAQCHDHPFDQWTQKQFFEMVAFTGGLRYRNGDPRSPDTRELSAYGRELRNQNQQAYRNYRRLTAQLNNGIAGTGSGLARLPKDYSYENARPSSLVTAHTLFGDEPELDVRIPEPPRGPARRRRRPMNERQLRARDAALPEVDSRAVYANWLTSPENPRFTKVIVNRLWKRFFGLGLIEPVDDLKDDSQASNPQLLDQLEKLMIEVEFDLKQFQRTLLNTEAYQRAASTTEPSEDEAYHFPGPLLRRMTAEQLWDSLLTFVVEDVDGTIGAPDERAERLYAEYESIADLPTKELIARIDSEARSGQSPRDRVMARASEERRQQLAQEQAKRRAARPLYRQLSQARRKGDSKTEEKVLAKLRELGLGPDARRSRGRSDRSLRRASELTSPAPAGHLLQQFGQSDREQIEAGHQDANVPQVLTLLNGFLEAEVLRDSRSALRTVISQASQTRAKIEAIYLATVNRPPARDELALWKKDVDRYGDEALLDLAWTLVNSHEFRFIR